ncbi:hypothetical protein Sgleb_06350 [Streptomyces glebosus]|uniref:Uncharacterized protein n=1 Tax=Streptomyces glebosus TaxID=249580 RepID=A0A640SNC1_9ACTN|nr:hypothetical protein Sgleb_06350 [Streptomyces glebosus]GHG71444.1 hypothetical protein GCM10010513_43560 [Streptomyces glebosus]
MQLVGARARVVPQQLVDGAFLAQRVGRGEQHHGRPTAPAAPPPLPYEQGPAAIHRRQRHTERQLREGEIAEEELAHEGSEEEQGAWGCQTA